jgi:hypothetical protein
VIARISKLLAALIASAAMAVQAAPIVFTNTSYDTIALAQSDAPVVVDSDGPSAAPPVQSDAFSGNLDAATGFALSTAGLLTTLADVVTFVGPGFAQAQSHFSGQFAGSGVLNLAINFTNLNSSVGGGMPEGHLFLLLTNSLGFTTGVPIPGDITAPGSYNFRFDAPVGGINTLDVVLFSSAFTTGAGQSAQNFASVTIGGTIPLPATPLLVAAAIGAMIAARRKSASRAV